jgi:hypothetical protein
MIDNPDHPEKDKIEQPGDANRVAEAEAHLRQIGRVERAEKAGVTQPEAVKSTEQQVQEAQDAIGKIPEFRPEVWRGLDDARRLEAVQNLEGRMAAIQQRPPVAVEAEPMKPGLFGGYSWSEGRMRISQQHLRSNDVKEIQDTIVHEGRHAYQHYAVTHPGFHSDQSEVDAWANNMQPGHYLRPEVVGQRAYQNQPVEADAWSYAGQIVKR